MRVIDLDYLPSHRQPAAVSTTAHLRLAIVQEVTDGRPTSFLVTKENVEGSDNEGYSTAWFPLAMLRQNTAGRIQSGSRFLLSDGEFRVRRGRTECYEGTLHPVPPHEKPRGAWRVLITDTKARSPRHPAWFVAGRNFSERATVTPSAWARYVALVDGADDMRPNNSNDEARPTVSWPAQNGVPAAHRYRVTPSMSTAQPAWVRLDSEGSVVEIRPAQLWRYQGKGTVRQRLPESLHPCHDWRDLCPSCALFGSADTRAGMDRTVSDHTSYRGHVTFSDAIAIGLTPTTGWDRAPLGSPKPSAGQVYLDHGNLPTNKRRGAANTTPLGHWGSAADSPRWRPIRGRKFYWRTEQPESGRHPRGKAREYQREGAMAARVNLVDPDAQFSFRVSFDGISRPQLGGLIASIVPSQLFDDGNVVVSLGGGKPFGFGAISTAVDMDSAMDASTRYLGMPSASSDLEISDLTAEFSRSVAATHRATVWPQIKKVLTLGAVANGDVWYPHSGGGQRGTQQFDEGFDFWRRSGGVRTEGTDTYLTGLPSPTAGGQMLWPDSPMQAD